MLKKRLIATVLVKEGHVVQSLGFRRYLPIGRPEIVVEYLDRWGIDEIALLDIGATEEGRAPDTSLVERVSRVCRTPLTVGGGVRNLKHAEDLMRSGADKVCINRAAFENPALISDVARVFGSQCVMVSLDARRDSGGSYEVFVNSGRTPTGVEPGRQARVAEEHGAGEILVNSIDRDGSQTGFDFNLAQGVADAVRIPVILCGGAGHPAHFLEAFEGLKISAVAAGNIFNWSEHSVLHVKAFLNQRGQNIRQDKCASYKDGNWDFRGRPSKKSDAYLDEIRFHPVPAGLA